MSTNTAPFTKSKGLSFLFLSLKSLDFNAFSTSLRLIFLLFFLKSFNLLFAFSFTEHLNADSLDLVELIMAFEEEFSDTDVQVEITDEDAEKILTVGDAVEFLKNAGVKE